MKQTLISQDLDFQKSMCWLKVVCQFKKYENFLYENFLWICSLLSQKLTNFEYRRWNLIVTNVQFAFKNHKGLIILPTAGGILADFWVPNEIDTWNFQHMLLFWFREASQNLSLFRQLSFHSFQGETKGKMLKNQCIFMANFQHFSFGPPLETMKKRVV